MNPQKKIKIRCFISKPSLLALVVILLALAASASPPPPPVVQPEPVVCEPEIIVKELEVIVDRLPKESKRKLTMAMEAHRGDYHTLARESYESVLADASGLQSDSFALWGLVNLFLDRDYADYNRDSAKTVLSVLEQKLEDASQVPVKEVRATEEARLLLTAMKVLFDADVSKDKVVAENGRLRRELANREEAISRLRELTVGQQ